MQQNVLNFKERFISKFYQSMYIRNINFWSLLKISFASSFTIYLLVKVYNYLFFKKEKQIQEPLKSVLLKDGRIITYNEYGDLKSQKVVFFFHSLGNCFFTYLGSSRKETHPNESIAKNMNLRMIHIDRPGYGKSTPHEKRNYITFTDDISQVASALGISKFAIIGVGSGGPYAISMAHWNQMNE